LYLFYSLIFYVIYLLLDATDSYEPRYKNKCLFDRHAVGGEYGASYKIVGPGKLSLSFESAASKTSVNIDERTLTDSVSAVVVYDNPYDNVHQMAHHFFSRCLEVWHDMA
jgi:isocitrate dehydrogenase